MQYCGQILTGAEFRKLKDKSYTLQVGNLFLDARTRGSKGRFLNHSCNPSTSICFSHVEGEIQVWFKSLRQLKPGDEITFDYNWLWEDEQGVQLPSIACKCGAKNPGCRKTINRKPPANVGIKRQQPWADTERSQKLKTPGTTSSDTSSSSKRLRQQDTEAEQHAIKKVRTGEEKSVGRREANKASSGAEESEGAKIIPTQPRGTGKPLQQKAKSKQQKPGPPITKEFLESFFGYPRPPESG
jgi:histone-lysine N-methyltransferase SETD2